METNILNVIAVLSKHVDSVLDRFTVDSHASVSSVSDSQWMTAGWHDFRSTIYRTQQRLAELLMAAVWQIGCPLYESDPSTMKMTVLWHV